MGNFWKTYIIMKSDDKLHGYIGEYFLSTMTNFPEHFNLSTCPALIGWYLDFDVYPPLCSNARLFQGIFEIKKRMQAIYY